MNPVERFRATEGVIAVAVPELASYLSIDAPGLLVILGNHQRRPEASDVAVVMRDVALRAKRLRIGVVVDEDADAAKEALGAKKEPVVAAIRDGEVKRLLEGMQDWAVYAATVNELVGEEG
jgi:hypothetical protein